jgi:inner membrane protein
MDPLTHTATGLFLSRVGLNRWTPMATPIILLAANAPDIDIVTAAGGSLNYLHYHRHLTHSLIAMPVMAFLTVGLVRLAARKPVQWIGAFLAALVAVASHLLLDLTNVYGVRLLLPFSSRWLQLDLTSVIDLWIWGVLLLAVAAPFIGRLVGSEITSKAGRPRGYGRGWAWFALAFLLLYNGARGVLHARAAAELNARMYQGADPVRVLAGPDAASPWRWRGVVETRDFYAVEDFSLMGEFDPTRALIFRKPDPNPAIEAARRTAVFREFLSFSQFPLWRVLPVSDREDAQEVEVVDLRFGSPQAPAFIATAVVDSRGRVLDAEFAYGRLRPR